MKPFTMRAPVAPGTFALVEISGRSVDRAAVLRLIALLELQLDTFPASAVEAGGDGL